MGASINMVPGLAVEVCKEVGVEIIVDRVVKFGKWAFDNLGSALVTPHLDKIQSTVKKLQTANADEIKPALGDLQQEFEDLLSVFKKMRQDVEDGTAALHAQLMTEAARINALIQELTVKQQAMKNLEFEVQKLRDQTAEEHKRIDAFQNELADERKNSKGLKKQLNMVSTLFVLTAIYLLLLSTGVVPIAIAAH